MKISALLLSTVARPAPPLSPAAAQDWPTRPVKAITTTSAGGLSDIFMRALGEELRQKWGQPLIIENRPGGSMNLGTRACADSAPDGYTICITNADAMLYNQFLFKNAAVQSRDEPAADHQRVPPDPHAGGELEARREERRRALRAVEGQGRHAVLSRARRAAGALHGDAEEGEGLRLGARAVQGRRRGGQRHHERLDADRAVRRGQRHRQHPGRPDDAARDDEQHPLAEFPQGAAADRGRLQRPAVAKLVRHLRAGRHAEGRSSTGCRRTSARSSTSRSSATAI